MKANPVSP